MSGVSNYSPYAPNAEGFVEALIDLKSTMNGRTVYGVAGFQSVAFEDISQGQAVYVRASDGLVGKAIANLTDDEATVAGFAQTSKLAGEIVRVIIFGPVPNSGLSPGESYYLSAASAGDITTTPPSTSGQYVTRVGEAVNSSTLIVQLEPSILLS